MAIAVMVERPGTAVPDRSMEQRMTALAEANRIREWRAVMKRDVIAARVEVTVLLADPPQEITTMRVFDLLLAVPKIGRVKALKWMNCSQCAPSKTVGGMSDRQRRELLSILRGYRR